MVVEFQLFDMQKETFIHRKINNHFKEIILKLSYFNDVLIYSVKKKTFKFHRILYIYYMILIFCCKFSYNPNILL